MPPVRNVDQKDRDSTTKYLQLPWFWLWKSRYFRTTKSTRIRGATNILRLKVMIHECECLYVFLSVWANDYMSTVHVCLATCFSTCSFICLSVFLSLCMSNFVWPIPPWQWHRIVLSATSIFYCFFFYLTELNFSAIGDEGEQCHSLLKVRLRINLILVTKCHQCSRVLSLWV